MPKQLGCVLIGPGNFGRGLARMLQEDERVFFRGVFAAEASETEAAAELLGGRAYPSLQSVLNDPEVDAVCIATPSYTHAELTVVAAQAGKHVFVEKPMALTVSECNAMVEAAETNGVVLMVGQLQRFFPLLDAARECIRSGKIGQPISVLMTRHDMLQRKQGSWLQQRELVGGLLHQSCAHELDWLRYTFGDVAEVFASAACKSIQEGLDFPDAAEINLRFTSGCVGTLSACMTSYIEQHNAVVHASNGSLRLDLRLGSFSWQNSAGEGETHLHDDYVRGNGHRVAFRHELRAFVDAALNNNQAPIPGPEGRATIEIVQAALISIVERQAVSLPLAADQHERRAYLEWQSQ